MGSDKHMNKVDETRTSYAKVASHGMGLGQIEARRYLAEQTPEALTELQGRLLEEPEHSRALAQGRAVEFGEYVRELVDKGQVPRHDGIVTVYRAGFDVGFSSYLVEALSAANAAGPLEKVGVGIGIEGETTGRIA